jgi:5-methylcytosine-specific restriction endonuclease McrA
VIRIDNKIEFIKLPWSFSGLFSGRYALRSGKRIFSLRWKEQAFQTIRLRQQDSPVPLMRDGRRVLWTFHNSFYWDDEELSAADVMALVYQRERRSRQKLETAHSLLRADQAGRPTRAAIPRDVRRTVFERDGGRCVECGSNFDLQYDHILPVARGGATTVQNLQLLCADCNRRKSDSL